MWYPTLSEVIRIYERVSPEQDGRIRDKQALNRMIMAPQHAEEDTPTKDNLAGKTSAMVIAAVEAEPFTRRTEQAGFAVGSHFLDRNGATLQASMNFQYLEGAIGGRATLNARLTKTPFQYLEGAIGGLKKVLTAQSSSDFQYLEGAIGGGLRGVALLQREDLSIPRRCDWRGPSRQ